VGVILTGLVPFVMVDLVTIALVNVKTNQKETVT